MTSTAFLDFFKNAPKGTKLDLGTTKSRGISTPLFGSNNSIESGESSNIIESISSQLSIENSISKSNLFQNQNIILENQKINSSNISTVNNDINNFANQVKNAFAQITKPESKTISKNNPESTNNFMDTVKTGFSDLQTQLGTGGIVAALIIGGVILLKK